MPAVQISSGATTGTKVRPVLKLVISQLGPDASESHCVVPPTLLFKLDLGLHRHFLWQARCMHLTHISLYSQRNLYLKLNEYNSNSCVPPPHTQTAHITATLSSKMSFALPPPPSPHLKSGIHMFISTRGMYYSN
jgi:hypothetical protein